MMKLIKEIYEEFKTVIQGKTMDAIIPPMVFFIFNRFLNLEVAIFASAISALLLLIRSMYKHQKTTYAWMGFLGVMAASIVTFLNQNPSTYFLPDILTNGIIMLVAIYSLAIKKPLAAYASHITRGWPLAWFWRSDVKPAYKEVTLLWLVFFILRTTLEVFIYLNGTFEDLVILNVVLGIPLLLFILTISYIYGIWRLRNLKGPGVDEFIMHKEPPFRGQIKGF